MFLISVLSITFIMNLLNIDLIKNSDLTYNSFLEWSVLILRLSIGWVFLQAGVQKILADGWTSESFLKNVAMSNPFVELFSWFATQTWWVDPMVKYGQLLIGLGLILGVLFRFSAFTGGLQVFLFWIASFEGGLGAGFPIGHGYLINSDFIYLIVLVLLASLGAGRLYGFDSFLERFSLVESNDWLKYFFG